MNFIGVGTATSSDSAILTNNYVSIFALYIAGVRTNGVFSSYYHI